MDGGDNKLGLFFTDDMTIGDAAFNSTYTNFSSLHVGGGDNDKTITIAANVMTSDSQQYDDAVVLAADVTLKSDSGVVGFGSTVDGVRGGTESLTIDGDLDVDGAIGSKSRLWDFSVTGNTNLGANVTTWGSQTYGDSATDQLTLSADVNIRSRFRSINLNGKTDSDGTPRKLFLDGGGVSPSVYIYASIGSLNALSSLTVTGDTDLGANVKTTGDQKYGDLAGDKFTLNANVVLESTGGKVQLVGKTDSDTAMARQLTITGNLDLDGAVGSVRALSMLTVTGDTELAANVKTLGSQQYDNAVVLESDVTLTANPAGPDGVLGDDPATTNIDESEDNGFIIFKGTVDSDSSNVNNARELLIAGNLKLTGNIGATEVMVGEETRLKSLKSLSVTGTSSIGANVHTTGMQVYDGRVTLTQDAFFHGTTATFSGGVDGDNNTLGLYFSDDMTIDGDFGSTYTNFSSLHVGGGGTTTIAVSFTTDGEQVYEDAVVLGRSLLLTAGGDGVRFGSTVDATGDFDSLTIEGDLEVGGEIGSTKKINHFRVTGNTNLGANVTARSSQTYVGQVTLSKDVTLHSTSGLGSVALQGKTDSDATARKLTVQADLVSVNNAIGSSSALAEFSVVGETDLRANVTTTGSQNYSDKVTLGADVTLTAKAPGDDGVLGDNMNTAQDGDADADDVRASIIFASTVTSDGTAADTMNTGTERSLVIDGNLKTSNRLGSANAFSSLTVFGTSKLGGDVETLGSQQYDNAVVLESDVTLTANPAGPDGVLEDDPATTSIDESEDNGFIIFKGTVDSDSSNVNNARELLIAGNLKLTGNIGATEVMVGEETRLKSLKSLSVTGTSSIGGNVHTTGVQTYDGEVTLTANSYFHGTTATFTGNMDGGGKKLGLFYSDGTIIGSNFGDTYMNFDSLHVGGGTITLAADFETDGEQIYDADVLLEANVELTAGGEGVHFKKNVDSRDTNNKKGLSITGNLIMDGGSEQEFGNTNGILDLIVVGNSKLGVGILKTVGGGGQEYIGAVTLVGDTELESSNHKIKFGYTVDSDTAAMPHALKVDGDLDLSRAVGSVNALSSFSVAGALDLDVDVTTTGNQTYSGAVTLTNNVTLTAKNPGSDGWGDDPSTTNVDESANDVRGSVFFNSTVDSDGTAADTVNTGTERSLVIDGKLTTFNKLGFTNALSSLTVFGSSGLGGDVITTGDQEYRGGGILYSNIQLTAKDGATLATVKFAGGDVSTGGSSYTLDIDGNLDLDGTIGNTNRPSTLSVSGTSDIGGNVKTSGKQTYNGRVTLTENSDFYGTNADFKGGMDGNSKSLGLFLSADTTLGGGTFTNLFSLSVGGGGTTTLAADITTTAAQDYSDAILLGADVTLTAGTGGVIFRSTVDSDAAGTPRKLNISGNLDANGKIGATKQDPLNMNSPLKSLKSLSVSGTSEISANVHTTQTQIYDGEVALMANVYFHGTTATFRDELYGNGKKLGLFLSGGVTLSNMVFKGFSSLHVGGGGTTTIATDISTPSGTQEYEDDVLLSADVTLTAGGDGVRFSGDVDSSGGARKLTVTGDLDLDGDIGSMNAMSALSSLRVSGNTDLGGNVKTTGNQQYGDDGGTHKVTLSADVELESTGGMVQLEGETDSDTTARKLTVTGQLDLDAAIGSTSALSMLTVTGASDLGADVTTKDAQEYRGAVTLSGPRTLTAKDGAALKTVKFVGTTAGGGNNLTVDGNLDLDADSSGVRALSVKGTSDLGAEVTTRGKQTYDGTVTLSDNVTLTAKSGTTLQTVQFMSTLTGGAKNLILDGNLDLDGAVNGVAVLSVKGTSDLGADVSTTGTQTYDGTVTLSGLPGDTTRTLTAKNGSVLQTVKIASTGGLAGGTQNLTVDGNLDLDAAITNVVNFHVKGTSDLGADITTTGAQTYDKAVTLSGLPGDTTRTLTANNSGTLGTVKFSSALAGGGQNLTVDGNLDLDAAITNVVNLHVKGTSDLGANITTTGAQTYDKAVTLSGLPGDTTRTLTAGGDGVKFSGTVDSDATARALTVTGNLDLDGAIGSTSALSSLTVTGHTELAANVKTTGNQKYGNTGTDKVTLNADVALESTGGKVQLVGKTDSDTTTARKLTITGNLDLDGAVGSARALSSLTVTGDTELAANVKTTGNQKYGDAGTDKVTLNANVGLESTGGKVQLVGKTDSDAAMARELTIKGNLDLDGAVGSVRALSMLTVTGDMELAANVKTTGNQKYGDAGTDKVTLSADVALESTGGKVQLVGKTDSDTTARKLTITGNLDLDGAVGSMRALSMLTVTGTSNLGADITTKDAQEYLGTVTLSGAARTLTAKDGVTLQAVKIASTGGLVGGSQNLTVDGNLDLDGALSGVVTLSVKGTSDLGAEVTTTGTQTYGGAVTLKNGARTLTANNGTALQTVTFLGTLGGGHSLTLDSNLNLSGGVNGVAAFRVKGTSTLGAEVTTTGAQTYDGTVTLSGAARTLTAKNGGTLQTVKFSSALAGGGQNLTVDGNLDLDAAITNVADFHVKGASGLGADVTTTGAQTYDGAVTLNTNVTLTTQTSAGNVKFSSTVQSDTTARSLTLTLPAAKTANAEFVGEVGSTTDATKRLQSLTINDADVLALGPVSTVMAQDYTATRIQLNGAHYNSDDANIRFNAAVELHAETITVDSDADDDATDGNITFTSTVNDNTANTTALTLDAGTGDVDLQENVGAITKPKSLTVSAANDLSLNSVKTVLAQSYTATTIKLGTGGTVPASAVYESDDGDIAFTGAVQLHAVSITVDSDANDDAADGDITFTSTLDDDTAGSTNLTLDADAGGDVEFRGTVGGTAAPGQLTVNAKEVKLNTGSVTTTSDQSWNAEVHLLQDTTLTAGSLGADGMPGGGDDQLSWIRFSNWLISDPDNATNYDLTVNSDFATEKGVGVKSSAVEANVRIKNLVVLGRGFYGDETAGDMDDLTVVWTSGKQTHKGRVQLRHHTTFRGKDADFETGLNGKGHDLGLDFSGRSEIAREAATNPEDTFRNIGSLTVGGSGITRIRGDVTTQGSQKYKGVVVITRDVTLTAKKQTAGKNTATESDDVYELKTITFEGLSSTQPGQVMSPFSNEHNRNVTVDAHFVLHNSKIGGDYRAQNDKIHPEANTNFGTFSVKGNATLGGDVYTQGKQTYDGTVTLTNDIRLKAHNSVVTFNQAVDDDEDDSTDTDTDGVTNEVRRTLTIEGDLDLNADVGATHMPQTLSVTGASHLEGNVSTAGNQEYVGAVTLYQDLVLRAEDPGPDGKLEDDPSTDPNDESADNVIGTVTFGSTVDSARFWLDHKDDYYKVDENGFIVDGDGNRIKGDDDGEGNEVTKFEESSNASNAVRIRQDSVVRLDNNHYGLTVQGNLVANGPIGGLGLYADQAVQVYYEAAPITKKGGDARRGRHDQRMEADIDGEDGGEADRHSGRHVEVFDGYRQQYSGRECNDPDGAKV